MSGTNNEDVKEQEHEEVKEQERADNARKIQVDGDNTAEDLNSLSKSDDNPMPSPQQEEEIIKKKYGGIVPKKPPLISKDHERAYFDSADWALGKGSQKPKGPLEALRPKLQPTPHQPVRSRRSAYAPADDGEGEGEGEVDDGGSNNTSSQDQSCTIDGDENDKSNNNTAVATKAAKN